MSRTLSVMPPPLTRGPGFAVGCCRPWGPELGGLPIFPVIRTGVPEDFPLDVDVGAGVETGPALLGGETGAALLGAEKPPVASLAGLVWKTKVKQHDVGSLPCKQGKTLDSR